MGYFIFLDHFMPYISLSLPDLSGSHFQAEQTSSGLWGPGLGEAPGVLKQRGVTRAWFLYDGVLLSGHD